MGRGWKRAGNTQVPRQSFTRQEDYKVMKCRIEIENFTGKSVLSVYQDFHARIFSKNLTTIMTFPARLEIEQKKSRQEILVPVEFYTGYFKNEDTIVLLFNRPLGNCKKSDLCSSCSVRQNRGAGYTESEVSEKS